MTAYPLRLRPHLRITVHAARTGAEGARTACGVVLETVGTNAAHPHPGHDITCRACRDATTGGQT